MEDRRIAALQIENQKLRKQNELLLEALASTGHEWRNLLSRLHLITTRLEHPRETSIEQHHMLVAQIGATAEQLQHIAELYLILARIETETLALQPRFLDPLRDLIEPILDRNRSALAESGQAVQLPVERGLVVWADYGLMLSAYDTLIRSALTASEPGGQIVLDLAEESSTTLLTVEVSGLAVPPHELERAFDPPACPIPSRDAALGISLYAVQRIVQVHGGEISAEVLPGQPATLLITMRLPRCPHLGSVDALYH